MGPSAFQPSFIPKGNGGGVIPDQVNQKKKSGLIGMLAVVLFVTVLLITVGLFVYNWSLSSSVESLKAEIALAESNIDIASLDKMAAFSNKLSVARGVVTKHRVVSNFLTLLKNNTVKSITFDHFSYHLMDDGQIVILLSGRASDYGSLALQESVLAKLKEVKSTEFSNLSISDKGAVGFNLSISIDPSSAIYAPPESVSTVKTSTGVADSDVGVEEGEDIDMSMPELDDL